jgi:hypothetical protein
LAVLGRLLISSAERLDLPDLLSIDSYSAGDWKYFIETLVGEDTPYIIKGFDVANPASAIGTQNCAINIADSAMYYPGSAAGSFYYGLPVGDPNAQPLVPALIKNATNYVYLVFTTIGAAADTRAFWDPNANGDTGGEFTQEVNTESVIQVQVNVSTGSFPDNTVPVAIIKVGPSVITSIEDARPMMFRLGTGGIDPNPANRFQWPALPSAQYEQMETPITLTSSSGPNPFQGGDKNLTSMKEWMDAVMTQLANLGGSQYWYEDNSTFSLINLFNDLNITFYSKGKYKHSSSVPGELTLTENLVIKSTNSPQDITIQAGTIDIPDEYVGYISLANTQPVNSLNEAILWTNGSTYLNTPNGSIGFFSELSAGDWVSAVGDPSNYTLQVEQFYSGTNGTGSVTTAANAKSVLLSGAYQGLTSVTLATFNQGIYPISDIQIQARSNPAIAEAGGNFLWLVLRSDTIEGIGSISAVTVSGTLTVTDGSAASPTGTVAEVIATGHGLIDGDRITVTAPVGQAGTYTVEVIDANTFFFNTTDTATGSFTGYYGLCTTVATATESANNGFESGETIIIGGTTNFNGEYVINYRSPTQFQFPIAGLVPPSPPAGSPVMATAASYAVLANSTITNVGSSVITGNLGLYPGTSVTGFPPGTVSGTENIANPAAMQAEIDATAAYTDLSTRTATIIPSSLDGQTLSAGVYKFSSGSASLATSTNGTLTFNGSATDIFVIQTASTLTTGAGGTPTIAFTGGALASNLYWAIGSSATLNVSGTGTFEGTLIAHASVTIDGGSVNGSLIALNGAVTISAASAITLGTSVGPPAPESAGTATLARLDVRSEEGITKVVQGETIDIGEGDSDNIQRFIGMSSLAETYPDYFTGPYNTLWNLANYNSSITDNLTIRSAKLTAMMADKAQDKTVKYLCNASTAVNTTSGSAQQLTFLPASSTLTILQPGSPGNSVISLPSGSPGISLLTNQSAYVVINRNAANTPSIVVANNANVPIDENVIIIASRLGDDNVYLWNGAEVIGAIPLVPGGSSLIAVTYYDPISTTLPTGNPVVEDGFDVQAGDTVLFSNLGSGNNEIYMANGTGTLITGWTQQLLFNGLPNPSKADTVIVKNGNSFADQVGIFNGTTWGFNSFVRYFNGTDYFEQSSLLTSTLNDNTTNGVVSSFNYTGSENMIIDFSIIRGTARDTGTLYVTTDGVNVEVAQGGAYINNSGTSFTGEIVSGVFSLLYTTTSTGSYATMKFMIRRWSNSAGGPGGVPSYSGGGSSAAAGGPNESIQFNNGGILDGNSNFLIDSANGLINLNGLQQSILSVPITIVDNTSSPAALFSYTASTNANAVIEYSIVRDGDNRTGRLLVANNTTITSESDDFTETGSTNVTLGAEIVGSNVVITYTSASTGFNGTFKYSMRTWS